MNNFNKIVINLKSEYKKKFNVEKVFDRQISEWLGMSVYSIAIYKTKAQIPYKSILDHCYKHKIDIFEILYKETNAECIKCGDEITKENEVICSGYVRNKCKKCKNEENKKYIAKAREEKSKEIKNCECGNERDFYILRKGEKILSFKCKACNEKRYEQQKKRNAKNKKECVKCKKTKMLHTFKGYSDICKVCTKKSVSKYTPNIKEVKNVKEVQVAPVKKPTISKAKLQMQKIFEEQARREEETRRKAINKF